MKQPQKITTGTWAYEPDPLFSIECPKCKTIIFMSREPLITRLKKWAKQFKKIVL